MKPSPVRWYQSRATYDGTVRQCYDHLDWEVVLLKVQLGFLAQNQVLLISLKYEAAH